MDALWHPKGGAKITTFGKGGAKIIPPLAKVVPKLLKYKSNKINNSNKSKVVTKKKKKEVKKGIILYSLMGYVEFYVP